MPTTSTSDDDPSVRGALVVDIRRVDAHPGDQLDLDRRVEVPADAMLSDVLSLVVEPFLRIAPRSNWRVRARVEGRWADVGTAMWDSSRQSLAAELTAPDRPAREISARSVLEIACPALPYGPRRA
ncbi:hypothetical protein ACPYO6_10610 [Georgenia sp. Z1344]|uniref:hypothetical protein n=1 Tax=Georgenia sp. Z1344 TaxID=3416706 RepID=UPI003CE6ADED